MSGAGAGIALQVREPWRPELGQDSGLDLDAQYFSEQTGGDLFDAARIGSRVAFFLSDVAGRRPDLNPILTTMHKAFRATSAELFNKAGTNLMESTELLVQAINMALIRAGKGTRFAPTLVGCYDPDPGVLAYINAGGQTALIRDSEGTRALPNVFTPLGLFTHSTYDASMQAFEPGAMLLVVTKGVTESLERRGSIGSQRISSQRLIEVLNSCSKHETASAVCRLVMEAAHRSAKRRTGWLPFRGKPLREDKTALAMVRTV